MIVIQFGQISQNQKSKEFLELIKSGKTEDLIPPWEPWWDSKSLIKDVTNPESKAVAPFMESCPPILSCPPLSQIMKNAPADCVPFNILNVLTSYIWTVRLFNGDHQESCVDATEAILTLSPVLSAEANFSSGEIAVKAPMIEAQNHSYLAENQEFHDTVKKDLRIILEGPSSEFKNYFVMSSLSDLHSLFTSCKKSIKPKKEKSKFISSSNIMTVCYFDTISHLKVPTIVKLSRTVRII
ncbi:Zinc finger HIT domain-containing protein 2 [Armadillidium vulgare]|nr:Zinc finger HIT domain-containing protein 2 [Armadillidium vulgare]